MTELAAAEHAAAAAAEAATQTRQQWEHAQAQLRAVQRDNVAATLRPTLVTGDDCPVCAQRVHELPAPLPAGDLDAAEHAAEAAGRRPGTGAGTDRRGGRRAGAGRGGGDRAGRVRRAAVVRDGGGGVRGGGANPGGLRGPCGSAAVRELVEGLATAEAAGPVAGAVPGPADVVLRALETPSTRPSRASTGSRSAPRTRTPRCARPGRTAPSRPGRPPRSPGSWPPPPPSCARPGTGWSRSARLP